MTTTMVIGFMLIGVIILGFLVATALLVDHPDIKPVKVNDNTSIFDNEDIDEIAGIIPGALNSDDYESIIDKY